VHITIFIMAVAPWPALHLLQLRDSTHMASQSHRLLHMNFAMTDLSTLAELDHSFQHFVQEAVLRLVQNSGSHSLVMQQHLKR